ncbi:type II toxin-antitoxin system RelE family toxin [Sulfurivermis fontis]|jgi:mRNA interferase RelE/StbE|uniref:type II toxin-antitoxin system RelE family toxin n=1 Tax=Sulfurivermis fontis TaxID=1972068 RepID=UPI000FDA9B2F|nr:type II toxin-antitoxin system RelE/ParE family toxin [Sulfurivermis fontis]
MVSYRIEWKRSAEKELRRLPREVIPRIVEAVSGLGANPIPQNCRKLVGSECSYRICIGDYRVIYALYQDRLIVEVVRAGHRSEVYR